MGYTPSGTLLQVPTVGLIANRPSPTQPGQTYFATDDAGGTLYISNDGSTWTTPGPRGELGYAQIVASASLTSVETALTGLTTTVTVGSRPVFIEFFTTLAYAATSAVYVFVNLYEDSTKIGGADFYTVTGGSGGVMVGMMRRNPSAGQHTYLLQGNVGSGTGTYFASSNNPAFIRVREG